MVWFLVDDTMTFHLKVTTAGNAAIGLWTRAGAWASFNRTDGYVPSNVARDIGNQYQIKNLLDAGLWSRVTGGYQFHDWADRQPSSEQVNQRRERARQRQARHRRKQQPVTRDITRDSHARARPSPLKDLGSLPHQGNAAGAAPPAAAAPEPEKNLPPPKHAQDNDFYEQCETQNCPLCDNEGYRPNGAVCDHIDRTETVQNGMAQIRAALQKKPQPVMTPTDIIRETLGQK